MFLTGAATPAAVDILSNSLTSVSSQMMESINVAAPLAMGIGATLLVIVGGWKLFKRVSK